MMLRRKKKSQLSEKWIEIQKHSAKKKYLSIDIIVRLQAKSGESSYGCACANVFGQCVSPYMCTYLSLCVLNVDGWLNVCCKQKELVHNYPWVYILLSCIINKGKTADEPHRNCMNEFSTQLCESGLSRFVYYTETWKRVGALFLFLKSENEWHHTTATNLNIPFIPWVCVVRLCTGMFISRALSLHISLNLTLSIECLSLFTSVQFNA